MYIYFEVCLLLSFVILLDTFAFFRRGPSISAVIGVDLIGASVGQATHRQVHFLHKGRLQTLPTKHSKRRHLSSSDYWSGYSFFLI